MLTEPIALFGSPAQRDALRLEAESHVAQAHRMMNRARALVAADRVDAIPLLAARRAALGSHLRRYQRLKHAGIFDPIVEHAPTSSKIIARTMKIDCIELGETFGAYHNRWLGIRASEWQMYRADMFATADLLATNLDAELRAIHQLIMISQFYAFPTAAVS